MKHIALLFVFAFVFQSCASPGHAIQSRGSRGIQVTINGVGNLTDGRRFFDKWYWPAAMGFVSGALSGYDLAKDKGLNYWWGNKNAYNRTSWSFYNVDKPDYTVDFGISNVGSKSENDCVPTTFAEIENKKGGERTYSEFVSNSGYEENIGSRMSPSEYRKYIQSTFSNSERINSDNLFDPTYMQNAVDKGDVFSFHFVEGESGHADNVRRLNVFLRDPSKNQLIFRQSHYNLRPSDNWRNVVSIFRIF